MAAGYSEKELRAQNLVRVHPDVRVIALGVPVPPYPGRTLDPPLRSRFQARNVQPKAPGTQLEALLDVAPQVPVPLVERVVGIREAVNAIEAMHDGLSGSPRMPHFDYLSLAHCVKVLALFPNADLASTIRRVFPVTRDVFGAKSAANCDTMDRILTKFGAGLAPAEYKLAALHKHHGRDAVVKATFATQGEPDTTTATTTVLELPCGALPPSASGAMRGFVETPTHTRLLMAMLQDHAVGADLCILGAKGSGKSDLARLFAHRLGYATELFSLFKDMTARDLLQRRATDPNGNTRWEDSPLVGLVSSFPLSFLFLLFQS